MKNKKIIIVTIICVITVLGILIGINMLKSNKNKAYTNVNIYNDYEELESKLEDNISKSTSDKEVEEAEEVVTNNENMKSKETNREISSKSEIVQNNNSDNKEHDNIKNTPSNSSIIQNNKNDVISNEENKSTSDEIVEKPKDEVKKDIIEVKVNYNAIEKIKQVALKTISENKDNKCNELQGKQINFIVEKSGNEFYPFSDWKVANIVQGTFFNTFYVYAEDIVKNGVVTQTYYYFQ